LVFPTQVKRPWQRTIFISEPTEDGALPFGIRAGTTDERELDKIDSVLSYSSSLRTAVRLILREPAFFDERKTFSFKLIRVSRFLKDKCSSRVQISEMGSKSKNSMDRWLWDLSD
jgi:hypothetical protein